jgi:hypothetical protein
MQREFWRSLTLGPDGNKSAAQRTGLLTNIWGGDFRYSIGLRVIQDEIVAEVVASIQRGRLVLGLSLTVSHVVLANNYSPRCP